MSADAQPFAVLPSISLVLNHPRAREWAQTLGEERVKGFARHAIEGWRAEISSGRSNPSRDDALAGILMEIDHQARRLELLRTGSVINATGVVLHTGIGRASLSENALAAISEVAGGGNIEIDLETGDRRTRGYQLIEDFRALTGCENALVVNNNAAATLMVLQELCCGKEVLISRGQLVEIGGSFRLPEIFAASGAIMKEVGTTNRTRLSDYENSITENTAAVLRVHPSNFRVVGFSETPDIASLSQLARSHGLVAIDDIGSGCVVDLAPLGLPGEPTFRASLEAGADLALGSGDKLLGGPQAGIIVGKKELVGRLSRSPLARAMRIDKCTLAALSATLDSYRRGKERDEIPVLRMLATSTAQLRQRAESLAAAINALPGFEATVRNDVSPVGGGSLPGHEIPTVVTEVTHERLTAEELATELRRHRIVPRIARDRVVLDLRSVESIGTLIDRLVNALKALDSNLGQNDAVDSAAL